MMLDNNPYATYKYIKGQLHHLYPSDPSLRFRLHE
jgi:hypothetical protein